jgi:hypothetical protein
MPMTFAQISVALQAGQMVALTQMPDGSIEFSGPFTTAEDFYNATATDRAEDLELRNLRPMILIKKCDLPLPPENL